MIFPVVPSHRAADVTLTVKDARGRPLPQTKVTVRQLGHQFLFGANIFNLGGCGKPALESAYRQRFAALLNYATLPFYWGGYEPKPGEPQPARRWQMAKWCAAHSIACKGHPLCWHEGRPAWLPLSPLAKVLALQLDRIHPDVGAFRDGIHIWT